MTEFEITYKRPMPDGSVMLLTVSAEYQYGSPPKLRGHPDDAEPGWEPKVYVNSALDEDGEDWWNDLSPREQAQVEQQAFDFAYRAFGCYR